MQEANHGVDRRLRDVVRSATTDQGRSKRLQDGPVRPLASQNRRDEGSPQVQLTSQSRLFRPNGSQRPHSRRRERTKTYGPRRFRRQPALHPVARSQPMQALLPKGARKGVAQADGLFRALLRPSSASQIRDGRQTSDQKRDPTYGGSEARRRTKVLRGPRACP